MVTTSAITAMEKFETESKKFSEIFFSEGTCTKAKVKFEVQENVTPVFRPKRSVPFVALDPINKELERLEDLGVIYKVDYSEWASLTVYMKKKNKICIYADFSMGLNDSLQYHNHPLPTLEEIFAKLNDGKFFS